MPGFPVQQQSSENLGDRRERMQELPIRERSSETVPDRPIRKFDPAQLPNTERMDTYHINLLYNNIARNNDLAIHFVRRVQYPAARMLIICGLGS